MYFDMGQGDPEFEWLGKHRSGRNVTVEISGNQKSSEGKPQTPGVKSEQKEKTGN